MVDSHLAGYIDRVANTLSSNELSGTALHAFFDATLRSAMEMTESEEGAILAVGVDNNQACLRIEIWEGPGVDMKSRIISLDPDGSVCAWSVAQGKLALVTDVKRDKRFLSRSSSPVKSELAVPVISRGKAIGVVNLESFKPHHYTQKQADDLQQFCASISHYWEIANLLDWRTRTLQQLSAFSKINESLINGSPITLKAIIDALLLLIPAQVADILLLDKTGDNLIIYNTGNISEEFKDRPIPRGTGIVWRCMEKMEIQNIPDVPKDDDYHSITKNTMLSMLAAPLIYNNTAIGVINLESENRNQFSLEDVRLLKLFAEQATIAVVNSEIISRFEATEALASLGTMTGNLAHRMNNIVGGIRVLSGLLADDLDATSPEMSDQSNQARQIEATAKEALDVVEQYEKMFSISVDTIDLNQVANQLITQIKRPQGVQLVVKTPTSPTLIVASRPQMTELLFELVRNAVKSVGESGVIEVQVEETNRAIEISVKDNGKGISKENLAHIFERGFKAREDSTSMGFGLWWIDNFVKSRGGQISPKDNEGGGTIFQIVFPKENPHNKNVKGESNGPA